MKKFSNFSNKALSKNEMKEVRGGTLYQCTCMSGNNAGSGFLWSDLGSNPGAYQSYSNGVCNGGSSQCTPRFNPQIPTYEVPVPNNA
jgi:natural product precursor